MKTKTIPQDRYFVMNITRKEAVTKLQEQENLRRKNPNVSFALGMFDRDRDNKLSAVVTFGSAPSPAITRGLCGEDEKLNIVELNSLWADSSVSNAAVVYFLREALSNVPKDIVLSYVPTDFERIGRVYKQLGFLYTGLTKERTNRVNHAGEVKHNRSKDYNKADTYLVPRPRKHRFVLFNVDGARRNFLEKSLKYDVLAY